MAKPRRIPTPLRQRWRRLCSRCLPVAMFLVAIVATGWLWSQHLSLPNTIGEVSALRVEAVSPSAGRLLAVEPRPITLYTRVKKGDVVARLDPGASKASLDTLRQEMTRLQGELESTQATVIEQQEARRHNELAQRRQLQETIEQLRLDTQDRQTLIQADTVELASLEEQYNAVEALYKQKVGSRLELVNIKSQRDVIQKRLEGNRETLREAQEQKKVCEERLQEYRLTKAAEMQKILAPLQAAVETQQKRLAEVEIQIENLLIRAPFDGVVTAIHKWAGQSAQPGDPVMRIARTDSQYILTYVRQDTRVRPAAGMPVEVSVRSLPRRTALAEVEDVGPQIEPVPLHQLKDPTIPEWGLPVRVTLPKHLGLLPGELVDVAFRPEPLLSLGSGKPAEPTEADRPQVAKRMK